MLNDDEIALLARSFYAMDDVTFSLVERSGAFGAPGTGQAVELLSRRLGLDVVVFQAAVLYQVDQMHQMPQMHHMPQMPQMRHMTPALPSLGPLQSLPMPGPTFTAPQGQFGNRQQRLDIIRAMASLDEQRELGNVTDEEVAARNRDYLAALRTASSQSGRPAPTLLTSPWPAASPPLPTDRFGSGPGYPPPSRAAPSTSSATTRTYRASTSSRGGLPSLKTKRKPTVPDPRRSVARPGTSMRHP